MPRPPKKKPEPLDLGITPLGPPLARLRKFRGYRQYSLAEVMGISRKQIADYERDLAHPNDEMIIRFAVTLKVSADFVGIKRNRIPTKSSKHSIYETFGRTRPTTRIKKKSNHKNY